MQHKNFTPRDGVKFFVDQKCKLKSEYGKNALKNANIVCGKSLTAYENVRNQLMPVKLWELMGTVLSC